MKLLYRTAEWHALAKLRMHTDTTLTLLEELTTEFGQLLCQFRDLTCSQFTTVELPWETAARNRREMGRTHCVGQGSTTREIPNPSTGPGPAQAARSSSGTRKCWGSSPIFQTLMTAVAEASGSSGSGWKSKLFNLLTVKLHFLGDYVRHIQFFGTTDSYSTQLVCIFSFSSVGNLLIQ
jgi:hypothetical protein